MKQILTLHECLLVHREHQYLNLISLFLQGQTDAVSFRWSLRKRWAEGREELWLAAHRPSRRDFHPLTRLLDKIDTLCAKVNEADDLRQQVASLLAQYRIAKAGDFISELSAPMRLSLFQRTLPRGWVYPCSVEDVAAQISTIPEHDLEGLWAIGLASPEVDNKGSYGTYFSYGYRRRAPGPVICLWAFPPSLTVKLSRRYSCGQIEHRFGVELSYGMTVSEKGGHTLCCWEPECLQQFTSEHVLLHEVGHHVQRRQRERRGLSLFPGDRACEQFAEEYALRMVRREKGGHSGW